MPRDDLVSASLAYRKNEEAILRGDVPEKYKRLLPHIPNGRVLEIGSAEGVMALLMARGGKIVTALERRQERHASALRLYGEWKKRFQFATEPAFVNADIVDRLDLLEGADTLVAVRMIYYLGADLDRVFAASKARNIVLCGNRNRAQWWRDGVPNRNDRADNYYASPEGMADVLARHGYTARTAESEGDPVVVGVRDD